MLGADFSLAKEGFSYVVSTGTKAYLFLLGTHPFLPLPLGIVALGNLERFGIFLLFLYHSTNSDSSSETSAAATQCEQIPIAFQLGQSYHTQLPLPSLASLNEVFSHPCLEQAFHFQSQEQKQ